MNSCERELTTNRMSSNGMSENCGAANFHNDLLHLKKEFFSKSKKVLQVMNKFECYKSVIDNIKKNLHSSQEENFYDVKDKLYEEERNIEESLKEFIQELTTYNISELGNSNFASNRITSTKISTLQNLFEEQRKKK